MPKIVDPDNLNQGTEIVIAPAARTIQLLVAGNLDDTNPGSGSGVTLQAVYSFLKEEWRTDTTLNRFRFPIRMFTKTDGNMLSSWAWADAQTRQLIRDGGWTEGTTQYAGIISLGNFASSVHQAYYKNTTGYGATISTFDKSGNLNEAVRTDGTSAYFKAFLRVQAQTYSEYDLPTEQGFTALEPVLYRLPLANLADVNTTNADITIDTVTPFVGTTNGGYTEANVTAGSTVFATSGIRFAAGDVGNYITITTAQNVANAGLYKILTFNNSSNVGVEPAFAATTVGFAWDKRVPGMAVRYLRGHSFVTYSTGQTYTSGIVVWNRGAGSSWEYSPGGGGTTASSAIADWQTYDGQTTIGGVRRACNRVIDGNGGTARQIYDWCQRQLRKTVNINERNNLTTVQASLSTQVGRIAELLVEYIGSNLQTKPGVRISSFDPNDTNDLTFRTIAVGTGGVSSETGVPSTWISVTYPFVSAGTFAFSSNLVADVDANTLYTMYFQTNVGGNFDTSAAIIVDNSSAADITGQVTSASIAWTFDYSNNVQGGRTSGTDAAVSVVAQGTSGATWVLSTATITRATGINISVNAEDERNYSNPV